MEVYLENIGERVAIGNLNWIKKEDIRFPMSFEKLENIEATGISILTKGSNAIAAFDLLLIH